MYTPYQKKAHQLGGLNSLIVFLGLFQPLNLLQRIQEKVYQQTKSKKRPKINHDNYHLKQGIGQVKKWGK
tara:strand:+ start:237 stop:446 length:210 start_codon:yes stop_codon:yes gene_type:complete